MVERRSGWILFAAIMLGIAGVMRIFDAIWAFTYHGQLPANLEGAVFGHSLKTYGWVYIVVAAVLIICAGGVLTQSQAARWIGVAAGAVACISAVWWLPFYPIWSLTYVLFGALVIYALVAYGQRDDATV
ncbi:MAG TPA: hypothetical protein VNV87_17670 [Acidimicrobiales bacterium]|jgi:hypothetical protein|nr:hypothetical protein [Acidimicrobiales bacterium]